MGTEITEKYKSRSKSGNGGTLGSAFSVRACHHQGSQLGRKVGWKLEESENQLELTSLGDHETPISSCYVWSWLHGWPCRNQGSQEPKKLKE